MDPLEQHMRVAVDKLNRYNDATEKLEEGVSAKAKSILRNGNIVSDEIDSQAYSTSYGYAAQTALDWTPAGKWGSCDESLEVRGEPQESGGTLDNIVVKDQPPAMKTATSDSYKLIIRQKPIVTKAFLGKERSMTP
jgi:hypothetical protein